MLNTSEKILAGHTYSSVIPASTLESILSFVLKGYRPGDFVYAALTNNFASAVCRADEENAKCLRPIALFLTNELPGTCWGSAADVHAWIKDEDGRRSSYVTYIKGIKNEQSVQVQALLPDSE